MSNVFTDEAAYPEEEGQIAVPMTRERESAIDYVLRQEDARYGLSVREIAERAKKYLLEGPQMAVASSATAGLHQPKHDTVTIQAYHKLINRLVALGHLEEVVDTGERGERLYRLPSTTYLHPGNPLTLDDIYEYAFSPTETLARISYAQDYLGEKKDKTLKAAAIALTKENPRDLFFNMINNRLDVLECDAKIYADSGLRDMDMRARVEKGYDDAIRLIYRTLGIPPEAVDMLRIWRLLRKPNGDGENEGASAQFVQRDPILLSNVLKKRIFGQAFLEQVDVGDTRNKPSRKRLVVSGSDGSTHASALQIRTAAHYIEDAEMLVTFNNAMGYVHQDPTAQRRARYPFYSVPITRTELDRPGNRGMIMARQMFRDLEESEYIHMARCATDVVQWRVDLEVFSGNARPMGRENITEGGYDYMLPAPSVHFRDGTVVPQEREFNHYKRDDAYGDMVQEGQNKMRAVLERIRTPENNQVFGGAVKSTQMMVFSQAVSWYISHGSKYRLDGDGQPLDPTWDMNCASALSDNQTMTYLLASLTDANPQDAKQGKYWVTCVVSRPFHATTEYYRRVDVNTDDGWKRFFRGEAEKAEREENEDSDDYNYWAAHDWEADTFAYLCRFADFAMFYMGHTGGNPPPALPRYEFLDSLRNRSDEEVDSRVAHNVRRMVEALDHTRVALDNDHNFMSIKRIIKIIPYVVYRAHEVCKSLGREWEAELRAAVIRKLGLLRRYRGMVPTDVALRPLPLRNYLERIAGVIREDEKRDQEKGDPGSQLR